MPASARASLSNRPAGPTKGWPLRSSSLPGCSPTKNISARREPSPKLLSGVQMFNATMKSAVAKKEIELALADRFGAIFERREKQLAETVSTGVGEIDARINGFPRGAISEIHGRASSGRTSLLLSALAAATIQEESFAL